MKNTFLTKDNYDILDCETVYYVDEKAIHIVDLTKIKNRTNMFCGICRQCLSVRKKLSGPL